MNIPAAMAVAQLVASVIAPQSASVAIMPATVVLNWDAVSNAASYNVYLGLAHNSYNRVITTTTNALAIQLDPLLAYHFAVSSVDSNGVEGDATSDFALTAVLAANLNFPQPGAALQESGDLIHWSPRSAQFTNGVWRVLLDPEAHREFYRTINTN